MNIQILKKYIVKRQRTKEYSAHSKMYSLQNQVFQSILQNKFTLLYSHFENYIYEYFIIFFQFSNVSPQLCCSYKFLGTFHKLSNLVFHVKNISFIFYYTQSTCWTSVFFILFGLQIPITHTYKCVRLSVSFINELASLFTV